MSKRVASHSHIRGLGLDEQGYATSSSGGFIGQKSAREAAGIIVDVVRGKRMAGRATLLTGLPGTGKTALALAIAQELGSRVPFVPMVGSEVFSAEVRKTAVLSDALRKAIGVRIREIKEVWEGEVAEVAPQETQSALTGAKEISNVSLTLRTAKGSKTIKLDASVYASILRLRIRPGDIIYIEAASGAIKRLGRSDSLRHEHDLEADEYVPVPRGEVQRKREVIQDVTLYDLDIANARPSTPTSGQSADAAIAILTSQIVRGQRGRVEITEKLRQEVNRIVDRLIGSGTAELVPGVLFIDEVHMLDVECFAFLNRAIESPLAPVLVLATNRSGHGIVVRGSGGIISPHGIPRELLDRLLIVRTSLYNLEETQAILALRAQSEGITPDESAINELAEIASQTSLRYALQLLTPATIIATTHARSSCTLSDVQEASTLFLDTKRSASLISSMNP